MKGCVCVVVFQQCKGSENPRIAQTFSPLFSGVFAIIFEAFPPFFSGVLAIISGRSAISFLGHEGRALAPARARPSGQREASLREEGGALAGGRRRRAGRGWPLSVGCGCTAAMEAAVRLQNCKLRTAFGESGEEEKDDIII